VLTRIIGQAADFFRLRLTLIEAPTGLDFEWHDDILYRKPPPPELGADEEWLLEAVEMDNEDVVHVAGRYATREEALAALERVQEDLDEMTRSTFEERYLR